MSRPRLVLGVVAAIIVVTIPLVASSCARAREEAEAASQEFRGRVASRAYGEIVRVAAPEFRESTTDEAFGKAMDGVKERLGAWQSSEPPAARVLAGLRGPTVSLIYLSHFERGPATEEFVWRIEKGTPILMGYHVKSSPVLAH